MKVILLAGWLLIAIAHVGYAQWNGDSTTNNSVCSSSTSTSKTSNVGISDGAGGMFTAWIDSRTSASQSIYVQRILSDGTLKFGTEVLVTDATGATSSTKSNLAITDDGSGGVILVWQDARNTTGSNSNNDIYGQRIDADGNIIWTSNGIRVTVADNNTSSKISPIVTRTSSSEVMVVFGDRRSGTVDLYAQKLAISNGATQWLDDVALHGDQPNTQTVPDMLADGSGGAFIVWQDPRLATTNANIYAQRIDSDGNILWGSGGLAVCTAANQQLSPKMVSDGAGGFVVTWSDQRATVADGNIYAQRIDNSGSAQWTTDGILVCDYSGNQVNPNIIQGGGGFILAWSDQRAGVGQRDIFAQSIDNSGSLLWNTATDGGIAITQATGNQPNSSSQSGIQLISDGSNGAFIVWDDARTSSAQMDLYSQHIGNSGSIDANWDPNGNAISLASNAQQGPVAVPDGSGNFIVSWRDGRSGTTNGEIYASKMRPTGILLPLRFLSITGVRRENAAIISWVTGAEQNTLSFDIQRSTLTGSFTTIGNIKANGSGGHGYQFTDAAPLSGTTLYRVVAIDADGRKQYSSVVKLSEDSYNGIIFKSYPNPVNNFINIEWKNASAGSYQISVTNISGQVIMMRNLQLPVGVVQDQMNISQLRQGMYILSVRSDNGQLIGQNRLIKK